MSPTETVETMNWDNRELLLRIYYQVVETNGTVRQHDCEIYGQPAHGFIGLRQIANEIVAYRERMRTSMKIAAAVLTAALGILTTILIMVIEHVL